MTLDTDRDRFRSGPDAATGAEHAPLVIFCTGGSGSRILARIVDRAGYFTGTRLNRAGDSRDLAAFLARWLDRYLVDSRWLDRALSGAPVTAPSGPPAMGRSFARAIERHRAGLSDPGAPWGWKAPRSLFVLPFIHHRYPEMRAIHLVRDGRDMAYSTNQNQVRRHGPAALGHLGAAPGPVQSIRLWSRANLAAARYCERLGGRYLRVRFETLCDDTVSEVGRMLRVMGCPVDERDVPALAADVTPPATIGRWRRRSVEELDQVTEAGEEALREFGYL